MSAPPSAQPSGTRSSSPLMQRLRGSLASSSMVSSVQPPASVQPPVPAPAAPIQSQPAPVELDQIAEEQPVAQPDVAAAAEFEQPMAVDTMIDTLNPPNVGGGTAKEAPLLSVTVEHPAIDQSGGVQYVETERSHELPPEVDGFLKKVEDNIDQIPQEIVIADPQSGQTLPRVMAQPVVVLPISAKIEDEGKKKAPTYSIRWLVEWSWKMMKRFSGKVVYRDEESIA